ncbi:hypothetical protein F2Q70_00032041 [Brassica cretica]|uniref:Uncharacterized protein n=1 Tax=Brassica cretica TaxID=69181 RepID=A0A8S9FEW7_BRACR|nr:hypothetical protein F2Q70_00032041 [Brassica cretica]
MGEIEKKEGVASIALLPCGSISGHFIHTPLSVCYGLHGSVNIGPMNISGLDFAVVEEEHAN